MSGVFSSKQFEAELEHRKLFSKEAVNYQGLLNDYFYRIQYKETKQVVNYECGYAIVTNPFTQKKDYFASNLIKSKYDGIGNRSEIDIVIILDISGSMGSQMTSKIKQGNDTLSLLDAAKLSIKKLISKMDSLDQLGLVTFDTKADTIFPLTPVSSLTNIDELLKIFHPRGGTDLYSGLKEGANVMRTNMRKNVPHRLFYLTDMNHNSDTNFTELFHSITVEEEPIFTTIIGLGTNLHSSFLTLCSNNKGAASFSAMCQEDLEEIIVDNYNYNFFPVAQDMKLNFRSGNFTVHKVYGSSETKSSMDKKELETKTNILNKKSKEIKKTAEFVLLYFRRIKKALPKLVLKSICNYNRYSNNTVLDIKSVFPSPIIEEINGRIMMKGGMLLLKLNREQYQVDSSIQMVLSGKDMADNSFEYIQHINLSNPNYSNEDYYSNQEIKDSIILFYFAKYLRSFAKKKLMNNKGERFYTPETTEHYQKLISLKEKVIKFVEEMSNEKKKAQLIKNINDTIDIFHLEKVLTTAIG